VLFAANLDVPAGTAVLLTGEPASGRSTLLHLLHLDITAGGGSVQFLTTGGSWLAYHPTSTDRYEMQQRMGFASPQACIEAVFFASVLVRGRLGGWVSGWLCGQGGGASACVARDARVRSRVGGRGAAASTMPARESAVHISQLGLGQPTSIPEPLA